MGFFDRLFGKSGKAGDSYGLQLNLKHPPIPEFAAQHAQIAVDAARNVSGIDLDYTPRSLGLVEQIVLGFHSEGLKVNQIGETVFSFGCYTGEVFVRNNDGEWKLPVEADLPPGLKEDNKIMVIQLPCGVVCNPIGKAFKLLELGEGESLSYFYDVFARESGTNE